MIFGKKLKYPLPKVPGNIRTTFENMCETLSPEDALELEKMIDQAINKTKVEAEQSPRVDIQTAEQVASRCRLLMEHYQEFSDEEKALVIGAVRYFVLDEDPFSDEVFASGFDDDAHVVNYVLEQLGIEGMYIELF